MNNYKNLINKNNLKVNKITYKGNSIIIHTPLGLFLIKENENIKTYDYLLSRGFNYLLPILDYDYNSIIFKYENSIEYNINEKAFDYIKLLSLLHSKTSYYININDNYNKNIYNKLNEYIEETKKYYDDLSSNIESKEYYSPNEYLFIRNISVIYRNIFIVKEELNVWYKKYKDNSRKRVCTLYNNCNLNDLIKTKEKTYLFNFEKSYIDSPIYDLNNFYNKYYLDFDFKNIYNKYTEVIELNDYEKEMLLILDLLPIKIDIQDDLSNTKDIKKKISKFYINLELLNFKKEKDRCTHKNKDNKK